LFWRWSSAMSCSGRRVRSLEPSAMLSSRRGALLVVDRSCMVDEVVATSLRRAAASLTSDVYVAPWCFGGRPHGRGIAPLEIVVTTIAAVSGTCGQGWYGAPVRRPTYKSSLLLPGVRSRPGSSGRIGIGEGSATTVWPLSSAIHLVTARRRRVGTRRPCSTALTIASSTEASTVGTNCATGHGA
jgi:hypothetical protein